MKKIIIVTTFCLFAIMQTGAQEQPENNISTKSNSAEENIEQTDNKTEKTQERPQEEKGQTGAAVTVEKFEYNSCEGDKKTKACKVEDLIKEDEKNDNSLP